MNRPFWTAVATGLVVTTLLCDLLPAQVFSGRDNRQARRGRTFQSTTIRSPDIGLWMGSSPNAGVTVRDTASQGAIAKVGFREGDRIVSVNGQPVTSERQFIDLLFAEDLRTQQVKVVVRRGGQDVVLVVQPATFVEEYSTAPADPLWDYGIIVDDRYTDRIVILRVAPRSAAYYSGLRAGDVITTVGGRRVAAVADLTQILSSGADARLAIGINRGNAARELELDTTIASGEAQGDVRANLKPNLDDPNLPPGSRNTPREGDRPRQDQPGTAPSDRPPTNRPPTDRPPSDRPPSDRPSTDRPATDRPATDRPATPDKPAVDKPLDPPAPAKPPVPKDPKAPEPKPSLP